MHQSTGNLSIQTLTTISWTDSLGWKNIMIINSLNTTKLISIKLTFRSQSEAFIRRSWYSVIPVLDTTARCRVKKAVVGVTELPSSRFIACWPSLRICFWLCCKNHEKVRRTGCYETLQNFKECVGKSERHTRQRKITECVYKVNCANCDRFKRVKLEESLASG